MERRLTVIELCGAHRIGIEPTYGVTEEGQAHSRDSTHVAGADYGDSVRGTLARNVLLNWPRQTELCSRPVAITEPGNGVQQTFTHVHLWLPMQFSSSKGDVRPTLRGIVLGPL